MDWDRPETCQVLASKKEYHCVICNQTSPSTDDKPMGLAVLVQVNDISIFLQNFKSELIHIDCFIIQKLTQTIS